MARQRADYMSGLFRSGVSTAHVWVLMKLRMHGELSMTGIAELLGIGLPNVTGLVDRMEERGLVGAPETDWRVVHVKQVRSDPRRMEGSPARPARSRRPGARSRHAGEMPRGRPRGRDGGRPHAGRQTMHGPGRVVRIVLSSNDYERAFREADVVQWKAVGRPDATEGARALVEKRAPKFERLG
jgi:hypothetical protein